MQKIFIYGPPASGKSTLARALASALKWKTLDTDYVVEHAAQKSIPQIFKEDGEEAFRDLESSVLKQLCELEGNYIISLGGGTLLRKQNRTCVEKTGTVWCLNTPSPEEIARRMKAAPNARPLGDKAKERATHYASFPHRIETFFDLSQSLVIVGENYAPALFSLAPLVADKTAFACHSEKLPTPLTTIPSGEQYKTIHTVSTLWQAFFHARLGRNDRVISFGGGVTSDLVGFAAATWMRGINWINVPTTLLAAIDASVGGKTGCDLPEGKNLIGAFHQPRLVMIDTQFLKTLPKDVLRAGRAEMIKHQILAGLPHEDTFKDVPTPSEVATNLAVKVDYVTKDPHELLSHRIYLNCGHTIGHAIESASNYTLSHGDCVAIGCVQEAAMAVERGLAKPKWLDEIRAYFQAAGLPTEYPDGMNFDVLRERMKSDKKHEGNTVTFVLPCGWGKVKRVKVEL